MAAAGGLLSLQAANPEHYPGSLLHWAAISGDAWMVKVLAERGAKLEARNPVCNDAKPDTGSGATPLMMAAAHGHLKAVQALIAAGADVNATTDEDPTVPGDTALLHAVANATFGCGNFGQDIESLPAVVRQLLAAGADVHAVAEDVNIMLETALSSELPDEILDQIVARPCEPLAPARQKGKASPEPAAALPLPSTRPAQVLLSIL